MVEDGAGEAGAETDDAWFRELVEATGDFYFRLRLSPTRAFEFVGRQAEALTGYRVDQLLADTALIEAMIAPDDVAVVDANFSRHATGDFDVELHWQHLDGHQVVCHVWARRRVRPDGSMVLDCICRDVTELRRAHEKIAEDGRRYRELTETMKDVVTVMDVESMEMLYISPSVTGLSGVTPQEVYDKPLGVSFAPGVEQIVADRIRARARAIESGEMSIEEYVTAEIPFVHRDGREMWLEVTNRFSRSPRTGRLELWSVSRDATERRLAALALAESERRYRLVAENASDVVILRDPAGIVTWVSPSVTSVLGWREHEVLGHNTLDFVHPDDLGRTLQMRADVAAGEAPRGLLIRIRQADGTYRHLSMSSRATFDEAGNLTGAVTGMRDVDEVVRQRERAERSEQRMRAIADARLAPETVVAAVRDESGAIVDFRYLYANRAACALSRLTLEQMTRTTLLTIVPQLVDTGIFAALVQCVESGEPLILHGVPVPVPHADRIDRVDVSAARLDDGLTIDWVDSTDRYVAARRIAESERRYRLLAENALDVIVQYHDNEIVWVSPALTETLGWRPEQWIGSSIVEFLHPDDAEVHARNVPTLLAGLPVIARYRLRSAHGTYHWVETHAKPFRDEDGHEDGIVASFRTVDVEVRAAEELERRARFDDLTGALKRDGAIARLSWHAERRHPDLGRAVLFMDVDEFKRINDTHGHRAGDAVLRTIAGRIADQVRDGDPIARMGGDEFLVVLESVADSAQAVAVAEKIRQAAEHPIAVGDRILHASVSIGVTLAGEHESPDEVVARADDAMYEAKASGRNRVVYRGAGDYASEYTRDGSYP